jgi:hypothetical protein
MRKGLLAWWRRRIVARGLAGAALFAVPVAVAALIGFGTSISGVAGGLSAVTSGPDAAPASQPTSTTLNHAVVALAGRSTQAGGGSGNVPDSAQLSPGTSGTGTVNGTGTQSGSTGGGSGGPLDPITNAGGGGPLNNLPGGGGGSSGGGTGQDTVNDVGSGVNNVLGGVNSSLQGLLGH